jgi:hypothetical protein
MSQGPVTGGAPELLLELVELELEPELELVLVEDPELELELLVEDCDPVLELELVLLVVASAPELELPSPPLPALPLLLSPPLVAALVLPPPPEPPTLPLELATFVAFVPHATPRAMKLATHTDARLLFMAVPSEVLGPHVAHHDSQRHHTVAGDVRGHVASLNVPRSACCQRSRALHSYRRAPNQLTQSARSLIARRAATSARAP